MWVPGHNGITYNRSQNNKLLIYVLNRSLIYTIYTNVGIMDIGQQKCKHMIYNKIFFK